MHCSFSLCAAWCIGVSGDILKENKRGSHDWRLHILWGCAQAHHLLRELHLTHTAEEISDQDAAWVSQEQISTVARSGHTLALWTHLKLGKSRKHKHIIVTHTIVRIRIIRTIRKNKHCDLYCKKVETFLDTQTTAIYYYIITLYVLNIVIKYAIF